MPLKITRVEMDWTEDGARCFSTRAGFTCPRCGADLIPDQEHLCGDRAFTAKPTRRKRSAGNSTGNAEA